MAPAAHGQASLYGVVVKYVRRGDLWRLDHADGTHVTVALIDYAHKGGSYRTWTGMIVESTHPSYPVGGYDIAVFDGDIQDKGRKVDLGAVYPHFERAEDIRDCSYGEMVQRALELGRTMQETGWEEKL